MVVLGAPPVVLGVPLVMLQLLWSCWEQRLQEQQTTGISRRRASVDATSAHKHLPLYQKVLDELGVWRHEEYLDEGTVDNH